MMGEDATRGGCPVCAGAIEEQVRVVCPRCDTPHHQECYSYAQGCAIFGCDSERPTTPLAKKGLVLPPIAARYGLSRSSRSVQMALFLLAAMTTFVGVSFFHLSERIEERMAGPVSATGGSSAAAPAQPRRSGYPQVGDLAPDFKLPDLDGREQSLADLTAGQVSVLTFWLARCSDCIRAFPKGVELSQELAGSTVRMVDVAYMGRPDNTSQWVQETGIRNEVLLDIRGKTVARYGVGTYTCFVLDSDGIIRYRGKVDGAGDAVVEILEAQDSGQPAGELSDR